MIALGKTFIIHHKALFQLFRKVLSLTLQFEAIYWYKLSDVMIYNF